MGFLDSVKGIAERVGESVERGAKSVSDNSKKFTEKSKIKREISNIESIINANYIELGKAVFEKISVDSENEYSEIIAAIQDNKKKLTEYNDLLMNLEDKAICSNCGAQIRRDQAYCDKCGQKNSNNCTEIEEEIIITEASENQTNTDKSDDNE